MPWLKVSVKFNRYGIRSFQRALLGGNKNLHWVSMSKIFVPPFQMRPEPGAGRSYFLLLQRKLFIRSSLFFQIHFGITYIWSMDYSFDLKIWFTVIFFLSKRVAFCSKYEFSLLNFHIFCSGFKDRITKMHPNCFDGELWPGHLSWFINSIFIYCTP